MLNILSDTNDFMVLNIINEYQLEYLTGRVVVHKYDEKHIGLKYHLKLIIVILLFLQDSSKIYISNAILFNFFYLRILLTLLT